MSNIVKVWVGNLPYEWTQDEFVNFVVEKANISKSDILSSFIAFDEKLHSRGFGRLTVYADIFEKIMGLRGVDAGKLKLRVNELRETEKNEKSL